MKLGRLTFLLPALALLGGCPSDDTSSSDTIADDTTGGSDDGVTPTTTPTTMPATTMSDTTVADTGMNDTGMNDTGMNDTGMNDTGMNDTGMTDTGMTDTGDTGATDTGTDTGATDTGTDTGSESSSESGSSDTGVVPMDGFGDCANNEEDDVCNDDEICLTAPAGPAFCSQQGCMDETDCPAVTSGDAVVTCADLINTGNICFIDCSQGETCPNGMVCELDACAWPVVAPGGGVCPDVDLGSTTPQTVMGDNTGLFDDVIPSCADGGEESLYEFTAPNDGVYTFDTFGTAFDTSLFLLDAACAGPEIACNDDDAGGGTQSAITLILDADQVVIVGVDSFDGEVGAFTLNITEEAAAPVDGDCCIPLVEQSGCEVAAVEACVCAIDDFCCETQWDATCIGIAVDDCDADC